MTTNQTIDGVPRQIISFPRELDDEMAEILAEKARVCGAGAFDIWELLCARFGTETASQPQGEPVAWMDPRSPEMHATISNEVKQHNLKFGGAPSAAVNGYSIPLYAEQPAPVAVVLPEFEPAFEKWWEEDGQYCRAGGGSYEKTFAYRAYEAALADVTRLNPSL